MLIVEFALNGHQRVRKLIDRYAYEPLLRHASLRCKGEVVELVPMFPPEALSLKSLDLCPVYCLLMRNGSTGEVLEIRSICNDAIRGAVQDVASDVFPQSDDEEGGNMEYRLFSEETEDGRIVRSRSEFHLEERSVKGMKLFKVGEPGDIPKIFTSTLWKQIEGYVTSDTRKERLAALKTRWFWDPDLKIPWLFLHDMVPFDDRADRLTATSGFVQIHGGSVGLSRILGRRVSLLHTHIMESEESHRLAFLSNMDKTMVRHHLPDQISLVANLVLDRADMGPAFHMYSWSGDGNIVREGMYLSLEHGTVL